MKYSKEDRNLKVMKKDNEKLKYLSIFVIILVISFFLKLNSGYLVSSDLKRRMYNDFKSYEAEIENLNKKLAGIIIANNYDINKLLLNNEVLYNFSKSSNNAASIKSDSLRYYYDDVYLRYNENMQDILEDGLINDTEREYINALYDYNKEILKEFNNIFQPINNGRFNTTQKPYRNIINNYIELSVFADEILNTQYFKILKDYRGDFSNFDIIRAEAFIKDVFSKVVPQRELNYNNMDDLNADSLIFTTHEDGDDIDISTIYKKPQYRIEYDKKSRQVYLRLVGKVIPSYVFDEEEIDSIAQDLIAKLDYEDVAEKTVSNIGIPQLSSFNYSCNNKTGDVWDKQKDLIIELDSYGLVRKLYMIDSDDNINMDFIDINETIKNIQKKADINDISKIRNMNGALEYIINVNYKGIGYNMVIDGLTGEFKYVD
jgi:hypothetical protein